MAIVVTADQRASRQRPDDVERMAAELNGVAELTLPFVRTAGDEMQGVVASGKGLATVAARFLEQGGWWIGVGLGPVESPLGATARDSRGEAFWHARDAVARAHKQKGGPPGPIAVVGGSGELAADLEAALSALAFIVAGRSTRQREAIVAARGASSLLGVSKRLNVSVSAVSQLLRAAGREEQARLEILIGHLAAGAI